MTFQNRDDLAREAVGWMRVFGRKADGSPCYR
jgi:hypothetical protein